MNDLLIWLLPLSLILIYALAALTFRYRNSQQVMEQRLRELEALSIAGRTLVEAQLNVYSLCELIAQEAERIIDTDTFQIGLFESDLYKILFWQVRGERQSPRVFDLSDQPGLIGWVRNTRQVLKVDDFHKEMDTLPARPRYVSPDPPRSAIIVPLLSGNQTLGVIAAQSAEPERFTTSDVRRLAILANQAAAAISHAYLLEREQTRAMQLELVGQIARQVNAVQDADEVMQTVVDLTWETFSFHPVSIFSLDKQTGEAVLVASTLPGLEHRVRAPAGYGLIGAAIAAKKTIVSNDTRSDPRFAPTLPGYPLEQEPDTQAEIVIPLIVDEDLLGVLDVHSDAPGVFGPQEQMVLEALAAQVATAISKARQWVTQREQAWLTTVQLQVAETISQSASMEDLLSAITRLTPLLVGLESCAILLWDEELGCYEGAEAYGLPPGEATCFLDCRIAIGDWPALDAVHVGMEVRHTELPAPWNEGREPAVSLYPLVAKGRMVGVMVVTAPGGELSARQDELLQNIALQAAQAIASEQSHLAQQEEAWVNTALLQVAEAVNSLIDLEEILNTIVRFVPMLVGVEKCLLLIWDERTRTYHLGPGYGLSEMERGLLTSFDLKSRDFPVLHKQEDTRVPDATYYTLRLPSWLHQIVGSEVAYAFPLYARARIVGSMLVSPPVDNRPLTGRRANILTGIGQQAAMAVVNDQLYREAAERDRLEQELDVARNIQASFLPPGSPNIPGCSVASFWQAARQVSGDFYDFLQLSPTLWGIVVADVADKGVPAALFMALSRTILRTIAFSRRDPALVLQRANEIICNDTTSDLFVTVFYAIYDVEQERLFYANAGHNPPLLLRHDGQVELLRGAGMALGVLDQIPIEGMSVEFRPGDIALFYTDGLTEALNEDYDEFGLERLRLAAASAMNGDAHAVMNAITEAVRDFAGETSQNDDVTLVVMKRAK